MTNKCYLCKILRHEVEKEFADRVNYTFIGNNSFYYVIKAHNRYEIKSIGRIIVWISRE